MFVLQTKSWTCAVMIWTTTTVLAALVSWCFCEGLHVCDGVDQDTPTHRLSSKTAYFNAHKDKTYWNDFTKEGMAVSDSNIPLVFS